MQTHAEYDYLNPDLTDDVCDLYLGDSDPASPLASPLFADLSGLPPTLVLTGDLELFYDQNLEFVRRAAAQGVDVTHELGPNMVHVYPLLADVSGVARRSYRTMGEFMRTYTPAGP